MACRSESFLGSETESEVVFEIRPNPGSKILTIIKKKIIIFENWNFSKLGVVHMFYGQISGAENDSGFIFVVWPNPGSKIEKLK